MQVHRKKNRFFLAYIIKNLYLCSVKSTFSWYIITIATMAAFASCRCDNTIMSLREAQHVVTQADSLWHKGKMYGVDEGDSATLAQAYERLKELSTFSRQKSEYAHACYHYGKFLRVKDDPVAAMQAFIDATHSGTKDYHILGRVYSNMGDICHLAGEYQLSYDMFEQSANMFLRDKDTLSYYYLLNDMAFELAEQGKKDEAMSIADKIYENCRNEEVLLKTLETLSIAYKKIQQYDSAIYYAHLLLNYNYNEPIGYLICAQSYSYLEKKDSAVFYAQKVLENTNQLDEINNALYILTNADDTKVLEDIRQIAAYRSDVQKLLEIRQGKLSQAVQLLEQDLNRKPDLRWLYAIVITLVIVGVIIVAYVQYKYKKHKLLSQQIEDLTIQNKEAEAQHANLNKKIDNLSQLHDVHHKEIVSDIERFCALIHSNQDLREHLHWNNFEEMCSLSDRYLYNIVTRLQAYNLSQKEMRLCILVLLKSPTNQMVDMIPYAQSGLGKFKYTTANKLGTNTSNLRQFLLNLLG